MLFTVERPDPKDLSTLVSAPSSRHTVDSNSCPELGAITKWSRMQAGFSTVHFITACSHRLNIELDLQSLFGLLCTAVLIG